MPVPLMLAALYRYGPIRVADVRDGLSNTIAIGEILHADGSHARLRVNWNTPKSFSGANEYDEFAQYCKAIPPEPTAYGWQGNVLMRGVPWTDGNVACTMYNHILGPNEPSCFNGAGVQDAIVSAGSVHSGGVNVVFADGHLSFLSDSTNLKVWRGLGSRVESDLRRN